MYKLNIPALPDEIIDAVLAEDWYKTPRVFDPNFAGFNVNRRELKIANYLSTKYEEGSEIHSKVNEFYRPIFNTELSTVALCFSNRVVPGFADPDPAQSAPHCDGGKFRMGINFIISAGGSNVTTTMFKELRKGPVIQPTEHVYHKELTYDTKHHAKEREWFFIETQRYHSVENIEATRILFRIYPVYDTNWEFEDTKQFLLAKALIEPLQDIT